VTVALAAKDRWAEVKDFAAGLAEEMVTAAPQVYIATMSKAKRHGRIFVDYFRNDYTATAIADYAVRARPGAPVALPIEWRELKSLESPSQFTIRDVLKRYKNKKPDSVSQPKGQTIPSSG
jgi:bifunctional non-homologous end joining protein LigD